MYSRRLIQTAMVVILFVLSVFMGGNAQAGPRKAQLITRDSYLSGIGVLVRVEALDSQGKIDRGLWDATAALSVDNPGISLSTDKVVLYNGLGTALVKFTGSGDFTLTANVNGMEASRPFSDLQGQSVTNVSGQLGGGATTWSGIIHVTDDLIVPTGHTLTVEPGTLVLLDGVSSGTSGKDIDVRGIILSLGTADEPVTFTAFDPDKEWGRINLQDGGPSLLRYTNITVGGRSPGAGHTGAGLVLNTEDTQAVFDYCSITDHYGKIMYSRESDLTFSHCHLARCVMGPEIQSTALLFEDSHITEMFGTNDNDGIYLHGQKAGQKMELRRSVVADGDDDAIDTLGSAVLIEDVIVRDFYDKGVSVNAGGPVTLKNMLIINNGTGVTAKVKGAGATVEVHIDNATIVSTDTGREDSDIGIHAYFKYTTSGTVKYFVTNSIIQAADPIKSDFGDPDLLIRIDYSNFSEPWPGTGNIDADPCFADSGNGDYHLKSQAARWDPNTETWLTDTVTSPCIDTGDMAHPIGFEPFPNGGIVNMGAFGATPHASKSYFGKPLCQTIVAGDINGDCEVNFLDFRLMALHWSEDNNP